MWLLAWFALAQAECIPPVELEPLVVVPNPADEVPPPVADASSLTTDVARGAPDGCNGRCPPRLTIRAVMDPSDDNVTNAEDLGYLFTLVGGELPEGIELPQGPVQGPELLLEWDLDPSKLRGTRIFVEVELHTVDEAGNLSTGKLTITVDQDAPDVPDDGASSGCSHGESPVGMAMLCWLLARRRQVRSSTTSSG